MFRKTFILVPNPKLKGGVGNYYKTAKKYFSENVKYVNFNSSHERGITKLVLNLFTIVKVLVEMVFLFPRTIVVNPSLGKTAIFRDGLFLLWSRILLKKRIVFWRGWNPQREASIFNSSMFKTIFKLAYKSADRHIVLNTYTKDKLIKLGIEKGKVFFSNTIVDDSYFINESPFGTSKTFTILFLTRIEKYKGIYETIETFEKLNLENKELLIAGDGSELENVKDYVNSKQLKNVKFLGFVNGQEKIKTYRKADLYLFPSYSEGMPNSVLEAMGSGLPIVCTKVGALIDFFKDNKMGYSYDLPIQILELVEGIKKIALNKTLSQSISKYNEDYAKQHFKASISITKLESLFKV